MAMVGLLTALPHTQLTRRLAREGRLPDGYSLQRPDEVDQATGGLNFTPSRPRAEIPEDFGSILSCLYSPKRYLGPVRRVPRILLRKPTPLRSASRRGAAEHASG